MESLASIITPFLLWGVVISYVVRAVTPLILGRMALRKARPPDAADVLRATGDLAEGLSKRRKR